VSVQTDLTTSDISQLEMTAPEHPRNSYLKHAGSTSAVEFDVHFFQNNDSRVGASCPKWNGLLDWNGTIFCGSILANTVVCRYISPHVVKC